MKRLRLQAAAQKYYNEGLEKLKGKNKGKDKSSVDLEAAFVKFSEACH